MLEGDYIHPAVCATFEYGPKWGTQWTTKLVIFLDQKKIETIQFGGTDFEACPFHQPISPARSTLGESNMAMENSPLMIFP
jgi:hypothetical protein